MSRDAATCTCPRCRRVFRAPADEYGDHECPWCGWYPGEHPPGPEELEKAAHKLREALLAAGYGRPLEKR